MIYKAKWYLKLEPQINTKDYGQIVKELLLNSINDYEISLAISQRVLTIILPQFSPRNLPVVQH